MDRNQAEEAREREYGLDVVADDNQGLQKHKSVMRWDIKKKKYLPVMLA